IGILGTTIEAMNRGYRVVLPTDCVAADPPEYAEQVLRYTFRNIAFLTTAAQIADAWGVA
ncbi:MAG: isochorismatase family protein, partial [Myxococcota bacterium]